jgi:PAS domain S-box-containing protein
VVVDDVIITRELSRRPSRPPDYQAESRALAALAQVMAESPQTLLHRLVETAMELCRAESAGVSIEEGSVFRWHATAGALASYLGGTMRRDFSPCGTVLDRNTAVLMTDPERCFPYIAEVRPHVTEVLLVPFYRGTTPIGTVWVVSHSDRKFDAEDQRVLTVLSRFASASAQALGLLDEAKRARGDAEDAGRRLAAIVESSEDAIVSKSLEGIIQSWNAAAERLFGYTAEEAISRPITLIIPPELIDEERLILERLRRGERLEHFETVRVAKDGHRLDISLTISPIRNDSGRIVGASKIARDITERKRMEKELREADRKKDDFIAMLGHELRNPLAPIRNGLQVLRLAGGDDAAKARARAMMDRQIAHMVRLIDDLLDVSRINRNKMELRRSRVALAEVVNSAVETARPAIEEAGHELTISLPPGPVFLDADLTRLSQVFGNLLTNSAKYTPRGGRIWVSAECRGTEAAVQVRDTGIGIPVESLKDIFDMFSQVDRDIERSTGGLGIGLALVKGLVEMHGGTVTAESAGEGQGSTFTVMLPILTAKQATEADLPEKTEKTPSRRILIADDNHDGAESLAMILRLLDNDVRTANDGLEALERAEAFRPEIILMDVGMPKLNGLDATRRIRQQAWGRGVTIIALTGWGQAGDRERSRAAGCDDHLVKPVDLSDLEKLLAGAQR